METQHPFPLPPDISAGRLTRKRRREGGNDAEGLMSVMNRQLPCTIVLSVLLRVSPVFSGLFPRHRVARCVSRYALPICALIACGTRSDAPPPTAAEKVGRVSAETTRVGMLGRYAHFRVTLRGSDGLAATGQLLQPPTPTGSAAVLLQDGRELNSDAIRYLPRDFGDVVVLSLDYPEELPYSISVRDLVLRGDDLRRAAARIPPMFSLAADYLAARADVDTSRLIIVATSFAVPFAARAAALDARFVNVGLVYGAGRMEDVLAANLTLRPAFLRRPAAWLAMRPFREFAPEQYVGRISPRPVIMVNGIDDPQMPRPAVEALYAAAREPRELIWLTTGHLMPTDSTLIRALVDTALARLPALRRADSGSDRRDQSVVHDRNRVTRAAAKHEQMPRAVPEANP
jgi:fermentation-respiration switch protein FrsA (DUF1100 family)